MIAFCQATGSARPKRLSRGVIMPVNPPLERSKNHTPGVHVSGSDRRCPMRWLLVIRETRTGVPLPDFGIAGAPAYRQMPSSTSRRTSSGARPSHRTRTSSVSAPRRGAGAAGTSGVPERRSGFATCSTSPTSGSSSVTRARRAARCASARCSSGPWTGKADTPTAWSRDVAPSGVVARGPRRHARIELVARREPSAQRSRSALRASTRRRRRSASTPRRRRRRSRPSDRRPARDRRRADRRRRQAFPCCTTGRPVHASCR